MKIEIDLPKSTVEQAELIAHEAKLASRNDAIQWSISIASQITEARTQGFKVMLTKEEKKPKELILGEANVQPQNGGQMISIQLSPENMVRLREISENPNHPAASAVQALARTVFQPTLRNFRVDLPGHSQWRRMLPFARSRHCDGPSSNQLRLISSPC